MVRAIGLTVGFASLAEAARRGRVRGAVKVMEPGAEVEQDWIITLQQGCTDADIKALCEKFGEHHACKMQGHPDEGGVGFLVVKGKESALWRLWHDKCVKSHEQNGIVSIPEHGPVLAQVPDAEAEQDWIVTLRKGCTDADIQALCAKFGDHHACKMQGHPDEGGVGYLVVKGKDSALQSLWHDKCVKSHEQDGIVSIPEDGPVLAQDPDAEAEQDWIVTLRKGCTDADIKALCEKYGDHHACKAQGHPDEGGIGFLVVKGRDSALRSLWRDKCVQSHEKDFIVTIPEDGPVLALGPDAEIAQDWIVTLRQGCTDVDIKVLCDKYGDHHTCKMEGHPDEGGVGYLVVNGKDSALQGLWHDRCVKSHEQDGIVSIPEHGPVLLEEPGVKVEKDWIVTLQKGCTDSDILSLCARYGKHHACKYRGNPDKGGIGYLVLKGEDGALQGLWHEKCVKAHEEDGIVSIPENGPVLSENIDDDEHDWIVTLRHGCTDADIRALCERFGQHHSCKLHGDPDEGGVGFLVVKGKEEALERLWQDKCVKGHEEDGIVSIPENWLRRAAEPGAEAVQDWIVTLQPGCTDTDIQALCDKFGDHHACKMQGHPDEGGVGYLVVKGKESALQDLWHDKCVKAHEQDGIVTIPEDTSVRAEDSGVEAEQDWVVSLRHGCTDADVEALCKQFGKHHACKLRGHPDQGGIGYLVVKGKDSALQGLWHNRCVKDHELDAGVSIPEDGPQ